MRVAAVALVCICSSAAADPIRTLRGVVTRAKSPTPIAGASVLTDRGEIATSDLDGYFAIRVTAVDRELTIAATGYLTRSVRLGSGEGVLHVELEPASGAEVIEVSAKAPEQTKPLSYQLTADEIRFIPGAGNDILRAAQVLPGVARIPYAFGGLVLRGTAPRDTSVFLDGIEVPIAFHFGGVTSFYPGGMLADLSLTSGGFDASHGRAQGGLVTLTTREPRTDRWRMGGSIGLLDSSVQAEGPLPKHGGILVGLRRSYFDTVADPFVADDVPLPSYWDFQIRTGWGDARTTGRITPMLFSSIDRVSSSEVSVTSSFIRVAVPYHRSWGKTTLTVTPWLGWNQLAFEDKTEDQTFSRPTFPGGVRAELLRDTRWGHLRGGGEIHGGYLAQTQVNVGATGDEPVRGSSTIGWTDLALWGETRLKLDGERFAMKPGLRVEAYGLSGEVVVDPRLNIHQQLSETITMRQAIGRYHQPPTAGDVDPNNGNPNLDSSHIDQLSLGVDAKLPHEILASVTGFFNYGTEVGVQIRNPRPGGDSPEPNLGGLGPTFQLLLEKQLGFAIYRDNLGRARSFGAEVLIKRNVGPWFTMLAYTLSSSERVDDPRLGLGWRPFELDQRHNLNVAVSRSWSKWRLGARLQVTSGNPYSPSTYDGELLVQHPWAGTLPAFVSLDLRADRRWHRCWGDINLYIDIQNATNRGNVEGREFSYERQADEDVPGLPIIPFIGVEFLPLI
ncbi:MAG: TonB-dependent receptor [Myxococcales bacterium]|nr:TonB-dependent receptor [Myxococcales bacterium]